jgi:hypothetical protein
LGRHHLVVEEVEEGLALQAHREGARARGLGEDQEQPQGLARLRRRRHEATGLEVGGHRPDDQVSLHERRLGGRRPIRVLGEPRATLIAQDVRAGVEQALPQGSVGRVEPGRLGRELLAVAVAQPEADEALRGLGLDLQLEMRSRHLRISPASVKRSMAF